jgi:hypothetical protein
MSVSMAGCAVTPLGNPVIATDTMLAKLFIGAALMLICWAALPGRRVMVVGAADKEKSAMGTGFDPPPPQEVRTRPMTVEHAKRTFEQECISTIPALSIESTPLHLV